MRDEDKTKAQLIAELREFRDIVEGQSELMVRWLPDGTIIFVNESYCRFRGRPREEVLTTNLFSISSRDIREDLSEMLDVLTVDNPLVSKDVQIDRPDGTAIWLQWAVQGSFSGDGQLKEILSIGRDITEHKEILCALHASESAFRSAFEDAAIPMSLQDLQGNYLRVNDALCKLMGYSEAEMLRKSYHNFTHEDDLAIDAEYDARLIRGEIGPYKNLEKRYINATGEEIWALINVCPVYDTNGRPLYRVSQVQDITERKWAEATLRTSEARFRNMFEQAAVGIAQVDQSGRFIQVNQRLCDIIGYSQEALGVMNFRDITFPDELQVDIHDYDRLLKGEVKALQTEKRYIRKDGSIVWVYLTVTIILNGSPSSASGLAVVEDITQRKKAEDALRQSENLYRALIESLDLGLCRWRPDTTLTYTNEKYRYLFGVTDESLPQKWIEFVPEEERQDTIDFYHRVTVNPEVTSYEHSVILEDGNERFFRWVDTPILNKRGIVIEFQSIGIDITERKQVEEQVKQHNRLLEDAVMRKTKEMERMTERLLRQEKLATIGQISGSIAHELRNPLGAIKQSVYYLNRLHRSGKLGADNPKVAKHLALVDVELETTNRVISDLLEATPSKNTNREQVNLQLITQEVAQHLHLTGKIQLTFVLEPSPFLLYADPIQLKQVMTNLLTNAIQADTSPLSLVTVHANRLPSTQQTQIQVVDQGAGIAEENLPQVFEPLFTTKAKGTGLGLSICKQIVENHGGTISLESQVGQGTTATICLPDVAPHAP